MALTIYTHPICLQHDMGYMHPESPLRLKTILERVHKSFTSQQIQIIEPPQANKEQLARVHDKVYIDSIFAAAPKSGMLALDPDTAMNEFSLDAALYASGAMVAAVDAVFQNKTQRVICLVRPPGHHAEPTHAMGFCIFNNIAVGVAHALAVYNCQKVAIVDFDVHHGNGTETMFFNNPKVCFWSSFQHPFYPGTDLRNKPAHIHLHPLTAGTNSQQFRQIVDSELIPLLEKEQPECIFISAGFDAHRLDPLANIEFETEDYGYVTQQLRKIADKYAQGRMISTLEGGYNVQALAESVVAHMLAML